MPHFNRFTFIVLIIAGLHGCALVPENKSANDASFSYRFNGFTLTPPAGKDWLRQETDASRAVFHRNLQKREFFQLSAVVTPFQPRTSYESGELFENFVERSLQQSYQATGKLALLKLAVKSLNLNKATCAEFEVQQGEKFFPPAREPRVEFIHQGYVCKHPNSALLIQGIVTEHRLYDADFELDKNIYQEAQTLIRSIQFTQ